MIGCIADDFTGATDIAGTFVERGYQTVLRLGVPDSAQRLDGDAVVVALKSRTQEAGGAVRDSLDTVRWLGTRGCEKIVFKYCSTFDSTDQGNIGPVAEALLDELGGGVTVFAPSYPINRRTVYQGHLFVGGTLLSDTGMRTHPLTPMTDSNLVNVLGRQSGRRVGLLDLAVVRRGWRAVRRRLQELERDGTPLVVADATSLADLRNVTEGADHLPLITGGAALASCLGTHKGAKVATFAVAKGPRVILAGSRSEATRRQLAHVRAEAPGVPLDPKALVRDLDAAVAEATHQAVSLLGDRPVVIHVPDDDEPIERTASPLIESALGQIAVALRNAGARRFLVAGGETSGAVVSALGLVDLQVGLPIEPGLPWVSDGDADEPVNLMLKSGNFGSDGLFETAWRAA